MNCGRTPADTGKSPHVDHIKPRSKYPLLELDISNMQVLCEQCNCSLKGTNTVDYRNNRHRKLLERVVGVKKDKKIPKREAQRRAIQSQSARKKLQVEQQQTRKRIKQIQTIQTQMMDELNNLRQSGNFPNWDKYKARLTDKEWRVLIKRCNIRHLLDQ